MVACQIKKKKHAKRRNGPPRGHNNTRPRTMQIQLSFFFDSSRINNMVWLREKTKWNHMTDGAPHGHIQNKNTCFMNMEPAEWAAKVIQGQVWYSVMQTTIQRRSWSRWNETRLWATVLARTAPLKLAYDTIRPSLAKQSDENGSTRVCPMTLPPWPFRRDRKLLSNPSWRGALDWRRVWIVATGVPWVPADFPLTLAGRDSPTSTDQRVDWITRQSQP